MIYTPRGVSPEDDPYHRRDVIFLRTLKVLMALALVIVVVIPLFRGHFLVAFVVFLGAIVIPVLVVSLGAGGFYWVGWLWKEPDE